MKSSLFGILTVLFLAGGCCLLCAQTNAPGNAPASSSLAFLTPAEQIQYAKAHQKALEDNPNLKSDGEKLLQQGREISTPADKEAFREKMNIHRQQLRQAMLKEDPTLGPVFTKIDRHLSEMKAEQGVQAQNSPGAPAAH